MSPLAVAGVPRVGQTQDLPDPRVFGGSPRASDVLEIFTRLAWPLPFLMYSVSQVEVVSMRRMFQSFLALSLVAATPALAQSGSSTQVSVAANAFDGLSLGMAYSEWSDDSHTVSAYDYDEYDDGYYEGDDYGSSSSFSLSVGSGGWGASYGYGRSYADGYRDCWEWYWDYVRYQDPYSSSFDYCGRGHRYSRGYRYGGYFPARSFWDPWYDPFYYGSGFAFSFGSYGYWGGFSYGYGHGSYGYGSYGYGSYGFPYYGYSRPYSYPRYGSYYGYGRYSPRYRVYTPRYGSRPGRLAYRGRSPLSRPGFKESPWSTRTGVTSTVTRGSRLGAVRGDVGRATQRRGTPVRRATSRGAVTRTDGGRVQSVRPSRTPERRRTPRVTAPGRSNGGAAAVRPRSSRPTDRGRAGSQAGGTDRPSARRAPTSGRTPSARTRPTRGGDRSIRIPATRGGDRATTRTPRTRSEPSRAAPRTRPSSGAPAPRARANTPSNRAPRVRAPSNRAPRARSGSGAARARSGQSTPQARSGGSGSRPQPRANTNSGSRARPAPARSAPRARSNAPSRKAPAARSGGSSSRTRGSARPRRGG